MKTGKVTTTENETSVEIDLFSSVKKLTPDQKRTIQSEVADFLVEQTLVSVADEKSPVSGGSWKKSLSKEYAKKKEAEIGNKKADIQFSGRTLDQLKAVPTDSGIKIGVFGERAPVADGHNNLSGKSDLPTRQFLPKEGENYKRAIQTEVDRIVADVLAESTEQPDRSQQKDNVREKKASSRFNDVESQADLYQSLREIFGNLSRIELRLAVFRNKAVLDDIVNSGLLDYL
jgi:hypothetical protein